MRGRPLHICWRHTTDELAARLAEERDPRRHERLQALLMLRRGASLRETSDTFDINYRTLQRWVDWYRHEGLDAMLHRTPGHNAPGRTPFLTPGQIQDLVRRYEAGQFRSVREAKNWVAHRYGVHYSHTGIYERIKHGQREASR